jgi:putative peptide zinc metalloprotease protein
VQIELAKLTAECHENERYLAGLEARRLQGTVSGAQIPAAKAALADSQERLAQLRHDANQLVIVAPISGTVLPPPNVPRKAVSSDMLDRWSGTPLDEPNLGAYLDRGTLLCLVGDPNRFEAVLHVQQGDIDLVQPGQHVRMMLDHLPGQVVTGVVAEIARLDLKVMPRELSAAGDLPARTDERGMQHPLDTWYQARVQFDQDPQHLLARLHGRAKITVATQSLGRQWLRYLQQTFAHPGGPRR